MTGTAAPAPNITKRSRARAVHGLGRIVEALRDALFLIDRMIRISVDTRKLLEADERMLKDMGLSRSEVESVVRFGRGRDGPGKP